MLNDKITRTTFIISLCGHFLLLGLPGYYSVPLAIDKKEENILLDINIEKPQLLPKIEKMSEEKKLKENKALKEEAPLRREILSKEMLMEETIETIESNDESMLRYQDMVKEKIQSCRRYPNWAKRQDIEGISRLRFTLLSNGMVKDIKLLKTSGSNVLDNEAIETIRRACPLCPIPKEFNRSSIAIEIALVFKLK